MILKILFSILILLLSTGELLRFDLGNSIVIRANDILVGLIVLTWVFSSIFKKKKSSDFLTNSIAIFVGTCLLSLVLNFNKLSFPHLLVAFLYLLRWVFYAGLYFVLKDFDFKFKKIIVVLLIISGSIFVIIGYIQYFFYSNLRNLFYLGWDDHLYRMFSSILDPNFAGAIFVLFLLLFTGLLIKSFEEKKTKEIIPFLMLSFGTLGAVYLTYSRSAFIMLVFSMFLMFSLFKKIKLIFVILIISFLVFVISSKNFYIENMNLFRIASAEARLDSAQNALKIIGDNPIFGVGFNAYRYAQIRYGFREGIGAQVSHADAGTDNSYLFVFATAGVFGLIAFIYLLKTILKKSITDYKNKKGLEKILSIVFISSISGIIINSLFINSFFYTFIMEWLWILLGLSSSVFSKKLKENN